MKNWLWRDAATVLFTGFQAAGTLGRILQDCARSVRIQGEVFAVRARIRTLDLYSGHAEGTELHDWIKERLPVRHQVFLVHGEEPAMTALAARLADIVNLDRVVCPGLDETVELTLSGSQSSAVSAPPRLPPGKVAQLDWQNDVSRQMLEINEALAASADETTRAVLIRRLQRALKAENG